MDPDRLHVLMARTPVRALLRLGMQRARRNDALLDEFYAPPPAPVPYEQRRYLEAFDAWIKNPTEENWRIKRSALQALLLSGD